MRTYDYIWILFSVFWQKKNVILKILYKTALATFDGVNYIYYHTTYV